MRTVLSVLSMGVLAGCVLAGCDDGKEEAARAAASASAAAAKAAREAVAREEEEKRAALPGPCQASGKDPVQLGTVHGDVHGLALDAGAVYYASWSVYGGRGDVGFFRKDGKGFRALASLELEPRGLTLDHDQVYFTSGIRLMRVPKAGGEASQIVEIFSSQDIAVDDDNVYGVPGDYGPYDRIAKVKKKGGKVDEIHGGKRPKIDVGPNGFSRIQLADGDLYITDSGNGRILRMAPKDEKPKPLVQGQAQAFELAIVGSDVVFSLAQKKALMSVPRDGGRAKKLASGLVEQAQVASNGSAVFSLLAGKTEDDPVVLFAYDPESGEPKPLAEIPALDNVPDIVADDKCVYWAQRKNASETLVFARGL